MLTSANLIFRFFALSLLSTSLIGYAKAADIIEMSPDLLAGMKTFSELSEQATQAQADLDFVDKQRKDPPRSYLWKPIIARFKAAEKQIAQSKITINFNAIDYPLPAGDWSFCVNRVKLTKTLNDEWNAMNEGIVALNDADNRLKSIADEIDVTHKALVAVQADILKLAKISELNPIMHKFFDEVDALDISLKVEPALAGVRKAVQDKRNLIYKRNMEIAKVRDNLATNLTTLTSRSCDLSGVYRKYDSGQDSDHMEVHFSRNPDLSYACVLAPPKASCSVRAVSPEGHTLVWWVQKDGVTLQWNFAISADFTSMTYKATELRRE